MTEEPYRWLEAIGNRRDYVREQLKGGSPVFAASLSDGLLLLGVGSGQSKVFELFDRHALAGLGHPADLERIRQAAIDAAHTEAFTRAPDDVSLRRLVGFGLSPQLKTNFEQLYTAPFLVELALAELGSEPGKDLLVRLRFDGGYQIQPGGVMVAASDPALEKGAADWLAAEFAGSPDRQTAANLLLQAWWCLSQSKPFDANLPAASERETGWRTQTQGKVIEIGWLARNSPRPARYTPLTLAETGL